MRVGFNWRLAVDSIWSSADWIQFKLNLMRMGSVSGAIWFHFHVECPELKLSYVKLYQLPVSRNFQQRIRTLRETEWQQNGNRMETEWKQNGNRKEQPATLSSFVWRTTRKGRSLNKGKFGKKNRRQRSPLLPFSFRKRRIRRRRRRGRRVFIERQKPRSESTVTRSLLAP